MRTNKGSKFPHKKTFTLGLCPTSIKALGVLARKYRITPNQVAAFFVEQGIEDYENPPDLIATTKLLSRIADDIRLSALKNTQLTETITAVLDEQRALFESQAPEHSTEQEELGFNLFDDPEIEEIFNEVDRRDALELNGSDEE